MNRMVWYGDKVIHYLTKDLTSFLIIKKHN